MKYSSHIVCVLWLVIVGFASDSFAQVDQSIEKTYKNEIQIGWRNWFTKTHHLDPFTWRLIPLNITYVRTIDSEKGLSLGVNFFKQWNGYHQSGHYRVGELTDRSLILARIFTQKTVLPISSISDWKIIAGLEFRYGVEYYFVAQSFWEIGTVRKDRREPGVFLGTSVTRRLQRFSLSPSFSTSFYPWLYEDLNPALRDYIGFQRSWYLFHLSLDVGFAF